MFSQLYGASAAVDSQFQWNFHGGGWKGVKMWLIEHKHSVGVTARRDRLYFSNLICQIHISISSWSCISFTCPVENLSEEGLCIWHQCSVRGRAGRDGLHLSIPARPIFSNGGRGSVWNFLGKFSQIPGPIQKFLKTKFLIEKNVFGQERIS